MNCRGAASGAKVALDDSGNERSNTMGGSLADRYWLLLKVNEIACTVPKLSGIVSEVCRVVLDIVPFDHASLSLYDSNRSLLRVSASFDADENRKPQTCDVLDGGTSHIDWVFEHKTTLLCRDLKKERRFDADKQFLDEGYRSACSAPLVVHQRSLGVLSLFAEKANGLSANHADILEEISKPIALAINSAIATGPPRYRTTRALRL
jgi:transcriptional regulator with GAF, ATPase, and Fis domain